MRKSYLKDMAHKFLADEMRKIETDSEYFSAFIQTQIETFERRIQDKNAKAMNLEEMKKYFEKKFKEEQNALTKTCANTRCKHGKVFMNPKMYFNKDKTRPDGLQAYCKYCAKDDFKHYYKKVEKERVACHLEGCKVTFLTNKGKKYCCTKHKNLARYARLDREEVYVRQNNNRTKRRNSFPQPNNGKTWSQEDLLIARDYKLDGATWLEVGKKVGRSEAACESRVKPLVDEFKAKARGKIINN